MHQWCELLCNLWWWPLNLLRSWLVCKLIWNPSWFHKLPGYTGLSLLNRLLGGWISYLISYNWSVLLHLPSGARGIGIHVCRVPRQRRQIRSIGLLSRLFLFASLFWSFLEHEVYKKHCSVVDLVRPMLIKRNVALIGFLHMFSVLTANAYVQLGLLIFKCLLDYTYLSRQTYRPFASALNYFFYLVLAWFYISVSYAPVPPVSPYGILNL
jgi:hypothetical protein